MTDPLARLRLLPPGLLACPDTHHPLTVTDDALLCPEIGRRFPVERGVPVLLPEDFAMSPELDEEDQFYLTETPRAFPRAHDLAHELARRPIADALAGVNLGPDGWLLNVGAGAGTRDLRLLERFTRNIVCLDISPEAVRRFIDREPYAVFQATADRLPVGDATVDVVVLSGVLHHVAGHSPMQPYLRECHRVLKPDGTLIAADPNLLYPTAGVMAAIDTVAQRVRPRWRHHVPHERPLMPGRLHREFRRAGFPDARLLGSSYVHNKMPWPLARFLGHQALPWTQRPVLNRFSYWITCVGRKG